LSTYTLSNGYFMSTQIANSIEKGKNPPIRHLHPTAAPITQAIVISSDDEDGLEPAAKRKRINKQAYHLGATDDAHNLREPQATTELKKQHYKQRFEQQEAQIEKLTGKRDSIRRTLRELYAKQESLVNSHKETKRDLKAIQTALSKVRELLDCATCESELEDPVVIKECGHTICQKCADNWKATCTAANFTCPSCRIAIQSTPATNYTVQEILGGLKRWHLL
ncbi:hypothetical protein V5O48_017351, partial [Marasmius crinis-equi]